MAEKFAYLECDVPKGMTLAEYRRTVESARPKRRYRAWRRIRAEVRGMTAWMHW